GEDGILRYWNGTIWTAHRQPDPAAPAANLRTHPHLADADPMAEYERQFDSPSGVEPSFDHPNYTFDARPFDSSPITLGTDIVVAAPHYRPQAALTAAPVVPAPTPEFAGKSASAPRSLGPIALGPASPAPTPVVDTSDPELNHLYDKMKALAAAPPPSPLREPAAPSEPLDDERDTDAVAAGIAPNRTAVVGAARIMAGAVVLIVLGLAAMLILSFQSSVGAGETKTTAIVTSLGATSGNSCTPVARFAVAGKSYSASSRAAISPCPIGLGESVGVVYDAANPASAARIEVGSSFTQYLWLIPTLGALAFVVGLIAFIVRAGSIVAGIAVLRDGRKPRIQTDAADA
ncbi:MAG TPA: DUF2510 domain-containing protein, partial [Galbitalea sp.]